MAANLQEAIQRIKRVGASNARIVPMSGQSAVDGNHQIEILESGGWHTVITGIKRRMAEDIVAQAVNRVILG
jgi:hypothetical protein